MRYSRLRRSATRKRYAFFILVAVLSCSLLYIFFAGTIGKYVSDVIAPILGSRGSTNDPTDDPKLTVPDEEDTVKVTENITANALKLYTIQMGAFIEERNAEDYALTLRTQGGAGYTVNDTYYRVLAVGFQLESDAAKVREQLKADDIDSQVYKIASPGVNMQITATKSNVETIKSAFSIWEDEYYKLEDILKQLDRNEISTTEAQSAISECKQPIDEMSDKLEGLNATQENNPILNGLLQLYKDTAKSLDDIITQNPSNKVAISSKLKYTYIELMMKYKQYLEQITG
ncbi:MAG TPA: SPOR domain-containing protein [Candidatus Atribacteria bacterium]|nr:SPOR domain-containing protein [Candidatus Atribacteria bacterium]